MADDSEKVERQRGNKDETTFARMQRLFEERLQQEQAEAEMWSRGEVCSSFSRMIAMEGIFIISHRFQAWTQPHGKRGTCWITLNTDLIKSLRSWMARTLLTLLTLVSPCGFMCYCGIVSLLSLLTSKDIEEMLEELEREEEERVSKLDEENANKSEVWKLKFLLFSITYISFSGLWAWRRWVAHSQRN